MAQTMSQIVHQLSVVAKQLGMTPAEVLQMPETPNVVIDELAEEIAAWDQYDQSDSLPGSPAIYQTHPSWMSVRGEDRRSVSPVSNASDYPYQGSISELRGAEPEISVPAVDVATNTPPMRRSYTKPVKPDIDINTIANGEVVSAEDGRLWMAKMVPTKGGKTRRIWTLVKHITSVEDGVTSDSESDGEASEPKTSVLMQMREIIDKLIVTPESSELVANLGELQIILERDHEQVSSKLPAEAWPGIQRMRSNLLTDEEREVEAQALTKRLGMHHYMEVSDEEHEPETNSSQTKASRSYTKSRPSTPAKGLEVGTTAQDPNGRTWSIYERRTKNGGVCQVWKLASQ